jgi:hypothetical protein
MRIREFRQSDILRLKKLHRESGVDCPFPKIKDLFPMTVLVDEEDKVVMAVGCIPAVELYFFLDRNWETPGMKMEAFKYIHEYTRRDMLSRGIVEAHAFVPPHLEKSFGRRLIKKFGWVRSYWPCFSRRTD